MKQQSRDCCANPFVRTPAAGFLNIFTHSFYILCLILFICALVGKIPLLRAQTRHIIHCKNACFKPKRWEIMYFSTFNLLYSNKVCTMHNLPRNFLPLHKRYCKTISFLSGNCASFACGSLYITEKSFVH